MSVHYVCAWHPWRTEEIIRSPGIGVKYSCELPCWCWELNSGLILEQYSFLTTKQYIQTLMLRLLKFYFKSICTVVLVGFFQILQVWELWELDIFPFSIVYLRSLT